VGLIPSQVAGHSNEPNSGSLTIASVSSRNKYQEIFLGSKGRQALKACNFTAICEPIIGTMCEPRRLTATWACTACCAHSFRFIFRIPEKSGDETRAEGSRIGNFLENELLPTPAEQLRTGAAAWA
jgi:hypothetical protein